VYGFLGDVNLFHGRAHEGEVHLEGMKLQAPEHADARDAQAYAYVRPHDLEVQRYSAEGSGRVVQLQRAIVVGPIARLELQPQDSTDETPIEAQITAERFRELGLQEGDTLQVSPRKARVFLHSVAD
jgi:sulfate/thiosulfate transport system ATP-binding protein